MERARTRGQAAGGPVARMVASGVVPHALLLAGPASVGKTTLALDLAAGLLCTAPDATERPCRACRACRLVDSGNHPDLHRLAPEGPGGQIGIDRVRALAVALALLPVEGGRQVAIVSAAQRLTEDAQNALLKTLEEPPAGTVIVLCADDEERLLPTIRSRCARLRLGRVATRVVEEVLAERGAADAPTAARLARLADGRPGLALAYALAPGAVLARAEVARSLLDLVGARPARRLGVVRDLHELAAGAVEQLARPEAAARDPAPDGAGEPGGARAASAADRRRAAGWLIDAWRDLARDLLRAALGERQAVRELDLLEELEAAAARLSPDALAAFLDRLAAAAGRLDVNVSPELELDLLALRWPWAPPAGAARPGG